MPGTLARDSLAPQLFIGATLNAAGSTNSTATQVDKPGDVLAEIAYGTITSTANSFTALVRIEAADDAAFSVNKVQVAEFPVTSGTDAAQSNTKKRQSIYIGKKYARSVVTLGGTAPVATGSTLKLHIERDRVTPLTDTA